MTFPATYANWKILLNAPFCLRDFLSRSLFTHLIPDLTKILPYEEVERQTLAYALKVMDNNVTQTVHALKMVRSTLYRKLKLYQLIASN